MAEEEVSFEAVGIASLLLPHPDSSNVKSAVTMTGGSVAERENFMVEREKTEKIYSETRASYRRGIKRA